MVDYDIYYYNIDAYKNNDFITFTFDSESGVNWVDNIKYTKLYSGTFEVDMNDNKICEQLFELFNGNNNPLIEKQDLIQETRTHTSMSVGDIIQLKNIKYLCGAFGFVEL